jgi:hypothetical protein
MAGDLMNRVPTRNDPASGIRDSLGVIDWTAGQSVDGGDIAGLGRTGTFYEIVLGTDDDFDMDEGWSVRMDGVERIVLPTLDFAKLFAEQIEALEIFRSHGADALDVVGLLGAETVAALEMNFYRERLDILVAAQNEDEDQEDPDGAMDAGKDPGLPVGEIVTGRGPISQMVETLEEATAIYRQIGAALSARNVIRGSLAIH